MRFHPFLLHIDHPKDLVIDRAACILEGWFLCPAGVETMRLRMGGSDLEWINVDRKDTKRLFGERYSHGFRAIVDGESLASSEMSDQANLDLVVDGTIVASKPLRFGASQLSSNASARKREYKREWLKAHLACPSCHPGSGELVFAGRTIRCRSCGNTFEDDGRILNFLTDDLKREFAIADWNEISAHNYDEVASALIEEVRHKGGKVLDCGSGLRSKVDESVICMEVAAFPNVDVLGVNQRLPFQDSVFDAVLSLNVLEHVTDPFTCAAELMRVLKPDGTLYCCVPFLQPEHGYPNHYFNATRSGLRQLFPRGLELVRHFVPRSGEPVWTLHWFLSWYTRELPPGERGEFLNLRLEDLLANPPEALLEEGWVARLSEAGKWQLASTTAAVFRKVSTPV